MKIENIMVAAWRNEMAAYESQASANGNRRKAWRQSA
jgi:hypothetical protein